MAVHQLVPHFRIGDATAQAAIHFRALLRRLGHWGGVFSVSQEPGTEALVQPVEALRVRPDDLVLLHHAIGGRLAARLLHLPCRRGVVFHNLSPLRFYRGTSLEPLLLAGRAQLAGMAPHVGLGIGVSEFNSSELRRAGYENVHTVPLFVEPERFGPDRVDRPMEARLASDAFTLVSVSRVVPHKRFEDLLALHREVLRLRPDARLLVAGGVDRLFPSVRALEAEAARTPGVTLLGRVSHGELVAVYRSGSAFVSMSEHEGFGVPLLEAMAAEVPVLAYAAAAVPETLGGAGIGFDEKRFALLAELAVQLGTDARLRARVLAGQRRRLEALGPAHSEARLGAALESVGVRRPARTRRRARRPRVGFVVQRYGPGVTGGAEALAAQVVARMAPHWDIRVLTSCATDHLTWANALPPGESTVDGVPVLRFAQSPAPPDAGAERALAPALRPLARPGRGGELDGAAGAAAPRAVAPPRRARGRVRRLRGLHLSLRLHGLVGAAGRRPHPARPDGARGRGAGLRRLRRGVRAAAGAPAPHAGGGAAHPPPVPAARPHPRGGRGGGPARGPGRALPERGSSFPGPICSTWAGWSAGRESRSCSPRMRDSGAR